MFSYKSVEEDTHTIGLDEESIVVSYLACNSALLKTSVLFANIPNSWGSDWDGCTNVPACKKLKECSPIHSLDLLDS